MRNVTRYVQPVIGWARKYRGIKHRDEFSVSFFSVSEATLRAKHLEKREVQEEGQRIFNLRLSSSCIIRSYPDAPYRSDPTKSFPQTLLSPAEREKEAV